MLIIIEREDEIKSTQFSFIKRMNEIADKRGTIIIGYKGGNAELEASWNKEFNIWWTTQESENRYWNAFGTNEPKWNTKYAHSITCEINPPFKGINRTIAGAFARDPSGKIYLMHRGKIGGGRKGIGKNKFWNEFRGEWQEVSDGEIISALALVASFESPRFVAQVANFVREVERVKTRSITKIKSSTVQLTIFKEEFSGTKKFSATSKEIEAKCDHGLVVNTLAKHLEKIGITIGNSPNIDLFVLDKNNNFKIMFEIKTTVTKTQCYEAIGQLYFNSAKLGKKPHLVAVFPENLNEEYKNVFKNLNIHCLTYKWINNEPKFDRSFKPESLMTHISV
jgi:hypothetical protein